MRGKCSAVGLSVLVAGGLLVTAATAGATVTATTDPNALASAMASGGVALGAASFQEAIPAGKNPAGVADSALAPFPLDGPSYAVL